ncbi:MAG: nucleoside recognition domain-containing protein [Cetobacterium sp.]|uniref:nucleoside recognition domain-containing protein n=1 Tax=unclassified Cetobacterium TaxID=2630983 RepID=UPI00064626F0|nr:MULTISPECIES: nucleoside recognition domain-containing protein [unclassified Cetobacterium]
MKDGKNQIVGYIALIFIIVFFSGLFSSEDGILKVFDFSTLSGSFGTMSRSTATFQGIAGDGAKHGFLFALSLVPAVMFALGVVNVVEAYGGLKAGEKLLTPILKPILGISGIFSVVLITSLQSMDATAGLINTLEEKKLITPKEKYIAAAFAFSAGGTIVNYFAVMSGLFDYINVSIGFPLVIIFGLKFFGANLMRAYVTFVKKSI